MRILKIYIISEHMKPFLLGLSVFAFILFMGNMDQLIKMVITQKAEWLTVLKLFLLLCPSIISYSLPMAVLLSVLLSFGRLNSDNEITALRAAGINPLSVITPAILLSILISLACVKLNDSILPRATYAARKIIANLAVRKPSMFFQQRTLIEDFPGYVFYIQKVKGNHLQGVQIAKLKEKGLPTSIVAKKGEILTNTGKEFFTLKLTHGTIDETEMEEPYRYQRSHFEEYYMEMKLPLETGPAISKRLKDMTIMELRQKTFEFQKKRINTSPLLTEINKKLSLAFAPLTFVLIAIPLGLKIARRGSKSTSFGLSLLLIIIYYLLFTGGLALGEKGLAPETIVWAPNIILGITGCFLMWKLK